MTCIEQFNALRDKRVADLKNSNYDSYQPHFHYEKIRGPS